MKKLKAYIAGDIMSVGSQYESSLIEKILDEVGIEYYSARLNKEINDKQNVSQEDNNKLAEKIVKQDTDKIKEADIIIFNLKSHALGTIAELGQVWGLNNNSMNKRCYFLYDDIRRTDIPETGDRRSWSINQYLYGLVLALSDGKGFLSGLDELKEELSTLVSRGLNTRYKVGDKIFLKDNLVHNKSYGGMRYNKEMDCYAYQPTVINEILTKNMYSGDNMWTITDEMINHDKSRYYNLLSDEERVILSNISEEFNYIARDFNGSLYIYQGKPEKRSIQWAAKGTCKHIYFYNHSFQNVKWEDEEPLKIIRD